MAETAQNTSQNISKTAIIEEIQNYLATELSELVQKPETPGAAERITEIQGLLTMYKFLPKREYGPEDVICPGGLVELDLNGMSALYLIVPKGGGLVTRVGGRAVQVITPNSPLGEALLGKKQGDTAQVEVGGKPRTYKVIGYH